MEGCKRGIVVFLLLLSVGASLSQYLDADAYYNDGNLYLMIGLFDKALESYQKAIDVNPSHIRAYSNLGVTYYKIGEYEKAV
ncbi:MAG: hypothetical protein DRH51_08020, partial [Candidatus Coatesbacteria bacterium]